MNRDKDSWKGVWSLTLGISALMMASFLPSGLLTPMAATLNVSEGLVGQTVTVTSIFGLFASLSNSYITRNINRKFVLVFHSIMTFVSCFLMPLTESFYMIMFGRALLGIAIGGYWVMATAVAFRLVSEKNIGKALAIIFGGASFAGMLSAPLGSFLGEYLGWQNVFVGNGALGLIAFFCLIFWMPSLPPVDNIKLGTMVEVLKNSYIRLGLVAIFTAFCGRYANLTYLRPYVENELNLGHEYVSILFLLFDMSYFIGTFFAAKFVMKFPYRSMFVPQFFLGIFSLVFIFFSPFIIVLFITMSLSGLCFANIPIVWSSWGPKTIPEQAETIGGLYVASTQASSALGAFAGGMILDVLGPFSVFGFSSIVWLFSAMIVYIWMKPNKTVKLGDN